MAHGFNFLGERVPDRYYVTPRACDVVAGAEIRAKLQAEFSSNPNTAMPAHCPEIAEAPIVHELEVPESAIVIGAVAHS